MQYNKILKEKEFSEIKNEKERIYYFPNNEKVSISGVIAIKVSESGGHRLITEEGVGYYVPKKWNCIKFFGKGFNFYFEA